MFTNAPLSPQQIADFKTNGYLILKNALDPGTVEGWKHEFETHFGLDITRSDNYPIGEKGNGNGPNSLRFSNPDLALKGQQLVREAVQQLGGGTLRGGTEQFVIHAPGNGRPWQPPQLAHIDLIPQHFRWRLMLGATTYATVTEKNGGCFVYWPGSHRKIWDLIAEHPELSFDRFEGRQNDLQARYKQHVGGDPVQFIAEPGTVMLWHSHLLHNGSMNVNPVPRIGIFGRWGQHLGPEGERETYGDMWEHWAI